MKKRRSIQGLKHSFYSRNKNFNHFNDITNERYKEILEKVKIFKSRIELERLLPELYLYMDTLAYLTEPPHSNELTFDEKLIFLIEVVDPELITLKTHKENETITEIDLAKAKNATEKSLLLNKKASDSKKIETIIREKLKIYDRYLAIYETYYSSKIKNKNQFAETPKKDLSPIILTNSSNITFNDISQERFEEINKRAQTWISLTNSQGNQKRAAYNLIYQDELLELKNKIEKIIFFILTVDPDLKALTIYYENGNHKQIKEEMILTLGFYSIDLIKLEEKYHKKFIPEKIISEFILQKSN